VDADAYCREVEAHLCRRNAGHLVRIVGPAFELVAGWAAQGIPLKVALSGIDACTDRRNARGRSRRPLRVEFCEADVVDAFDRWRRAVGIGSAGGGAAAGHPDADEPSVDRRPKPAHSLRAHLDRVVVRLTDRLAAGGVPAGLETAIETVIGDLAGWRDESRGLRGEARARLVAHLEELDGRLMTAARAATPADRLAALDRDATGQLQGYRDRMPAGDFARVVATAADKLLREHWRLPDVIYGM
jgi:hypothetical protein